MKAPTLVIAPCAALTLVLAACGGSDPASTESAAGGNRTTADVGTDAAAAEEPTEEPTEGAAAAASCRGVHESLAEAWDRVAAGDRGDPGGEDDPISIVGRALSACSTPDEWLEGAASAGSIPEPLAPMTGLRFRCVGDPALYDACGDLTAPEEPVHGLEGADSIGVGRICGDAVDAVGELLYRADRSAFDENLAGLTEIFNTVTGSDRVSLPAEVEQPAGEVVGIPTDDPGWGQAFDDLVAACNALGEGGGSS